MVIIFKKGEGSSEGVESIDPESLRNSILSRSNQREVY